MLRQITSNLFQTCSLRIALCKSCMIEVKKCFGKRLWLDLCTKQVVGAKACANQFLPCSSSGIAIFGMRTVQADSSLNSEQVDTLFISVGDQEGGLWGGGGILGRRPKKCTWVSGILNLLADLIPSARSCSFYGIYFSGLSVCM